MDSDLPQNSRGKRQCEKKLKRIFGTIFSRTYF